MGSKPSAGYTRGNKSVLQFGKNLPATQKKKGGYEEDTWMRPQVK